MDQNVCPPSTKDEIRETPQGVDSELWMRIGPEVLCHIFSWFSPTLQLYSSVPYIYTTEWKPIRLVCRQWHDVLHSIPQIFSYLPKIGLHGGCATEEYIDMLKRYLGWSANAPLKIQLDGLGIYHDRITQNGMHPALALLMEHASRWSVVKFRDVPFQTINSLRAVKGQFGELRYLNFSALASDYSHIPFADQLDAFEDAGRLEVVKISAVIPGGGILIPWDNLKSFACVVDRRGLAIPVEELSSLEELEIVQGGDDDSFGRPKKVIPGLKVLRYSYNTVGGRGDTSSRSISRLRLPTLEDVQMKNCKISDLSLLITASKCGHHLRRIAFRTQQSLIPGELTGLLEATPYLAELDISQPPDQDAKMLVYVPQNSSPGAPTFLPHLERLHIHCTSTGSRNTHRIYCEIGRTRCDIDLDSSLIRQLKEFRLVFETKGLRSLAISQGLGLSELVSEPELLEGSRILRAQGLISGWTEDILRNIRNAERIKPSVAKAPTKKHLSTFKKISSQLCSVLDEIEHFTSREVTEQELTAVQSSRFYNTVEKVIKLGDNSSHNAYSNAAAQARKILDRWEHLFSNAIDRIHWAEFGQNSLVYIPNHSGSLTIIFQCADRPSDWRAQGDPLRKFFYGVEDTMHDAQLLWHRN